MAIQLLVLCCVTGLLSTVTVEGLPIFLLTELSERLHWSNLSWMHIKLCNAQTFTHSQILIQRFSGG